MTISIGRAGLLCYCPCVQVQTSPAAPPPTLLYRVTSITDRLDLAQLFPRPQPVEVELGSGDGSFLAHYARLHPERNFIGVERLLGRIRKLDRKGQRAGLTNLRGLRIESAYFLEYLLPRHSVAVLHLYFPDPWPKKKHLRRRLVNDGFPSLLDGVLAPGGMVYLRTDHEDYFAQMLAVFAASPAFGPAATPPELAGLPTDFEREFEAKGIRTNRAAYRKVE
jgi:tRNA (guanine-N7-)-methyltransferase